jgi:hypothetical protein
MKQLTFSKPEQRKIVWNVPSTEQIADHLKKLKPLKDYTYEEIVGPYLKKPE